MLNISLLFSGLLISTRDRVVPHLVRVLASCNNAEELLKLLLLQVSLGKVLKLPLREHNAIRCRDGQLGAVTGNGNAVRGKVSSLSVNLEAVLKVLLERSNIKYLILNRSGAVNNELYGSLLCLNLETVDEIRVNIHE